jgi:RHS repeat-associated protein
MAARLDGSDPGKRIGTAIMLQTMPGDRFHISADAFYEGQYSQDDEVSTEDVISSLVSTLTGGADYQGIPLRELPDNMRTVTTALGNPQLLGQLDNLLNSNNNTNAPKAHLNYLFFNDKMELVPGSSGSLQVPSGPIGWTTMSPSGTGGTMGTAPDNGVVSPGVGFLLVYIDNQSIGKQVWFDNLMIGMYKGVVTEENHYYPFGLTLNTSQASNVTKNPLKLTTKELESSFGLNAYDFGARMQDMQLGRWFGIDPLAEKFYKASPYSYAGNNPVYFVDIDGLYEYPAGKAKQYTEKYQP